MRLLFKILSFIAVACLLRPTASADTVTLVSNRDTTIYQDGLNNSNGAGPVMFVGTAGFTASGSPRRALIGFNIAGNIPAGSTINSVQLTLVLNRAAAGESTNRQIELHPLLANWGEGIAGMGSGTGGAGEGFPTDPDGTAATWSHAFYDRTAWMMPGGDFAATASASTIVGTAPGPYTWSSTMPTDPIVADVQGWLNNPSSNFGWLVLGDESVPATAQRFFTREGFDPTTWPSLFIDFTPMGGGGSGSGPQANPEPSALLLLGLGALGLLGYGWWRRRG
jgi:hypothetical protein